MSILQISSTKIISKAYPPKSQTRLIDFFWIYRVQKWTNRFTPKICVFSPTCGKPTNRISIIHFKLYRRYRNHKWFFWDEQTAQQAEQHRSHLFIEIKVFRSIYSEDMVITRIWFEGLTDELTNSSEPKVSCFRFSLIVTFIYWIIPR